MFKLVKAIEVALVFYRADQDMSLRLQNVLDHLEESRPGIRDKLSITWVKYSDLVAVSGEGSGTGWREHKSVYPASIVKLFYAVAAEQWLSRDMLLDSDELRRALHDMISYSSNDATSYIIDLLSGTTSGVEIYGNLWNSWQSQRLLVNSWLDSLGWIELKAINCCQKTWSDGPFGREKIFYGQNNENRNSLTTIATARMLESIMTSTVVSPPACTRLQKYLFRSLDLSDRQVDPLNQIDGFLGEGLPSESLLWSKAGWMSEARHDAAWWHTPNKPPSLLVVFSTGKVCSNDYTLLPELARLLSCYDFD